jgi:hypothetical protein
MHSRSRLRVVNPSLPSTHAALRVAQLQYVEVREHGPNNALLKRARSLATITTARSGAYFCYSKKVFRANPVSTFTALGGKIAMLP